MEWCNLSLFKRPISDKIPVPPSEDALPIGTLPSWSRLPYDAKIPILWCPDGVLEFVKPRVGEKLFKSYPNKEFEMLDPYMHFLPGRYDSLNDPYLKHFFRSSFHFKQMVKKGFITNEGKVRCTLAEFNQYRLYLYQIWAMEVNQLRRQQMSEVREKIKQNRKHKRTKDDSFSPFSKRKKPRLLHTSDVESDWEWQNNLYDENYGSEILIQKEIKDMELHQRAFQKKIEKGYRYQHKAIEEWLNEETRHIRNVAENEREKQRKREKKLTSTWERRYCNSQAYMEKELEIRNRYNLLLKVREEKRKLNTAKQWRKDSYNLLLLKEHQRKMLWQQYDEVQKRFEKMHYEDEQWDLFDDIYSSFWDVEESLNDTESSFENLGKEERTFDQRLEDIVMDKKPRKHSQESKKRKEVTKELLREKDDIALPKNKTEKKRRRISFKVEDNDYPNFKTEIMDKLSSSNIPDRFSEPEVSIVDEEAKSAEESSHPHISRHSLDTDLSALYTQVTPVKESISKLSKECLLNHEKSKSYDASSDFSNAHDIVSKSDIHGRSSLPDSVPDHTFLSKSSVEMLDHQSFDSSKIPLFSMPSQRSFSKSDTVVQVLELTDDKSDENDLHIKEIFKSSESNRDEISNNVLNGVQEPELRYDQAAEKEEKEEYISKSNASTSERVISDELEAVPSFPVYITPQPSPKLSKTEIPIDISKKLSFDESEEKLETDEQLIANDVKTKLSTAYLVPDSSQSKKESEERLSDESLQDYKDHQFNFAFQKEYYDETSKCTHVNKRDYNVSYFIGELRQTNFVKEQEGSKRALTIADSKSPFNEHLTKDAKRELSVPYMKSDNPQPKNALEKYLNSDFLQSFQFPPIDLPSQNIVYEGSLEHKSIPATGRSNETSNTIGIHFDLSEDSIALAKVTNETMQKDSYFPTEFPKQFTTDQSKMFQDKKSRKASRKSDGRIIQSVPKDYERTSFLSLHFDKKDFQFPDIFISKTANSVDQTTFLQFQQEDNSVYDRSIEAVGKLESPSTQDFLHPTVLSKMQNYNWQKIVSSVDKKKCAFPKLAVQQSFQPLHVTKRELKSDSTSKLLIHDATFQDTEMDLQSEETILLQLPKFEMKEYTVDKPSKVNVEEQNQITKIQPDQVLSAVENTSSKLKSENILCELPLTDTPFKDRDIDYLSNQELLYPTTFPSKHEYPLEKISEMLDKNMNQIVKKPSEVDTKENHLPSFVEEPFSVEFDKDYKFNIEKETSEITKELQIAPFPKFHDLFSDHDTSADKSINDLVQKKQIEEHQILGSVAENFRSLNDIGSESREWKAEVIQPFATLQLDKESPVNISEVEPKEFSISELKQELSDKDFMLLLFPESYDEKKLSYTNDIKIESLHDKMSLTMKGNESIYNEQPMHVSTEFPQDIDMKPETSSEQMHSSPEISEQNVSYNESIDSSESKDAIRIFAKAYQDTRKSIELYETLSNFDESKLKNFYSYNISDKEAESNSLKSMDSVTQSIYTENQTSLPSVCPSSVVTDSSEKMYDIPDIINDEVMHSTIAIKCSNSETLYKSSEQLYSTDIWHSVENVQEMYYPLQSENVNGNYDIKNFPFICSLSDFTYVSNEISPLECTETILDNAANFMTVIPHDILIDSIPQICDISVDVNQQLTPYSEFIGISDKKDTVKKAGHDDISEDFAIISGSASNQTLDNFSNITLESDPTLDVPELFVESMKQSISEQKTSDAKKDFNQIRLSSISYDSSENLGGSLSSSILAQDDFNSLRYERSIESKETFGASIPPPEFSGKEYFAKEDKVVEISHIQESDDKLPFNKVKEKVVPGKYFKTFDRQLAEDISDAKRKEVSVLANMLSGVSIADAFKELKSESFVQNGSTVNFTSDTGLQRTCSRTFYFTELQGVASKEHLSAIRQFDNSECLEELHLPKETQIKREQLSTIVKLNDIDDTSLSDNYPLKKTIQQLKVRSNMEVLPTVSSEYFKNLADSLCADDKVKDTIVGFLEKDNFAINILPELSQKADLFKFDKSPDEVPWLKPCSALDSSQVVDLDVFAPTTCLIGVDKKREFVSSAYSRTRSDSSYTEDKVKETSIGHLEKDHFTINILPPFSQQIDDLVKMDKRSEGITLQKTYSAPDSDQIVDSEYFLPTQHITGDDTKKITSLVKLLSDITVTSAFDELQKDSKMALHNENFVPASVLDFSRDLRYVSKEKNSYEQKLPKYINTQLLSFEHYSYDTMKDSAKVEKADIELEQFKPLFQPQLNDIQDKTDQAIESFSLQIPEIKKQYHEEKALDSELQSDVNILASVTIAEAFGELQTEDNLYDEEIMDTVSKGELSDFVPASVLDFSRDLQYVSKEKNSYEQKLPKYINTQLLSFEHYSYDTMKDSAKVEKADIELEQFKPLFQPQLNDIQDKTDQAIESFSLQIPEIKKQYHEEKALDSELQSDVNILASVTIAEAFGELQTEDNLYDEEIMDTVSTGELSDWFATADNAFVTIKKGSIEPEEFKSFSQPQLEHKQDKAFQAIESFSLQIPHFKREHQQQYGKEKTLESELLSEINILASLTISEAFEELQTEDTVYDQRLKDLGSKSQLSNSFVLEGNKIIPVKEEVIESEQFESFSQPQLDDVQVKALQAIESFSLQIPRAEREHIQQYRKEEYLESEMLSDVNLLASLTIAEAFEELQTEDIAYDERVKDLDSKSQLSNPFASADNIYTAFEEKGVKLKQFRPLSGLRLNDTQSEAFQAIESSSFNLSQVESDQQYRNKLESELLTDVNMLANIAISKAFEELKTDKPVFDEETMHLNSKSELAKSFIVPDDTSLEFKKKDAKPQQFKSLSESLLDDIQDETFKAMQSFSLQIPLIEQYYNQQYRREKLVEPELLSDINTLANITVSKALEELQTEDIFHDEGIINLDSEGELPDTSTVMDYTYIISEEEFSKDVYNSQLTIREIISEDFFHKSIHVKSDSIIEGKSKTKDVSMGLDYVPLEKTPLQSKDTDSHHRREKDEDAVYSKKKSSINAIAQIRTSVPLNKIDQRDCRAGFIGSATISSEQNYVAILHDEEENGTQERVKASKYTITHISTSENLGISPDGGWTSFYGSASITPDQNMVDTKEKYVLSTDSDNQLGQAQLISGIVTTSKQNVLKRSDLSNLSTSVTDSKSKIEYIEEAVSMLARNTIAGALYDLNLDENLLQQNLHSDSAVLISDRLTTQDDNLSVYSRVDQWRRACAEAQGTEQEFAFTKGNLSFLYPAGIDASATSDEYIDALSTERDVSIISDDNIADLTSLKYETNQKYSSDYKLQEAETGKIESSTKELSHKSTRASDIRAYSRVDKWRKTSAKMEETDQEFAFAKGNISFLYTPEIDVSTVSDEYIDALSTERDVSIISDDNIADLTSLKYETNQKYSSDYKLQEAETGKIESSTKELSHKSTRASDIRAYSRVDKWRKTSAKMEETDQEFAFAKGNISFLYTPEIDVSTVSDEYIDALSTERDVSIISDDNIADLTLLKYETNQKYSSDYKLQEAETGKIESSTKELSHKSTRASDIIRAYSRIDKWRKTSAKMEETDQEFAFAKGNISFLYTPEIDVSTVSDEYIDALSTERDVSITSDDNIADLTSLKYETNQKCSSDYKLQEAETGKIESSTKDLSDKSTRASDIIRAYSKVDKWRKTSAKMEETNQEFAFAKGNISFLYTPEIDVSTVSDEYIVALSTERDVSITSDDNIADLTSMKYESDQTYTSVYKFQKVEMRKTEISGKRVYATADLNRRVSSTSDVKMDEEREMGKNINLAERTEFVTDVNAKQSEQTLPPGIRTREDYVNLSTYSKVDKWRRACAESKEQEYVFPTENFSFLYQSEVEVSASSDENYTDALSSEMEVSITTDENVTDLTSVKYGSEQKYSSVNKLQKAKMEETESTTREVDATGELSVSLTSDANKLGKRRKVEKATDLLQRIEPVVNLKLSTEQKISPGLKGTKQEFLFSEGNLSFLYQKETDFYAYSDENYTDALSTERDISVTSDENDADLISLEYGTDQKYSSQNKFQKEKTESSSKDLSHRSTTKVYDNLSSYSRIDKWRRECAEAEITGKEFFYYLSFLYPSEIDFSASSDDYTDALSTAMDASVTSDEIVPPWKCESDQKPISLYKESKISGDEVRSINFIPSLSKELDVHHIGEKDKDSAVSKTTESIINTIAQIHTSVSLNKINERDGQAGFIGSATISSEQNYVAILHDEEENDTEEREAKTSKYTITHISTSENLGISPDGGWTSFYGSASITPDQNMVDIKEKYVLSTDSDSQLGKAQVISGIVTTSKQNVLKRSDISILSTSVASSKKKNEDIEEAVSMLARNTIAEAFYDLNLDENWLQENVNSDSTISVADKMVKPYVGDQTPSTSTHVLNELNNRFNLIAKKAEQSLPPGAALQQNFPVVSAYNKDYKILKGCEEEETRDLQYVFAKENFSFLYSTDSDISVTFNADRSDLSSTTDDYITPESSFTDLASLNYSSDPKYSLFRFSKAGTSLEYNNNVSTLKPSSVEEWCSTEYYKPMQDKDSSTANFIHRSKHKESEVSVTKYLINDTDSEKKMHGDLKSSPRISCDQLQKENLSQSLSLDSSKTVRKGTESFLSIETQEITSAVQLLASLTISDAFSELEQETFDYKSSRSSDL